MLSNLSSDRQSYTIIYLTLKSYNFATLYMRLYVCYYYIYVFNNTYELYIFRKESSIFLEYENYDRHLGSWYL